MQINKIPYDCPKPESYCLSMRLVINLLLLLNYTIILENMTKVYPPGIYGTTDLT